MIIIMECTDCEWGISMNAGERAACGHAQLPASNATKYGPNVRLPTEKQSAINCLGFREGLPIEVLVDGPYASIIPFEDLVELGMQTSS